ncbi:efflux RND transporter permease subunit [Bacillus sp. FJAT-44742]|uniref:efflux RND transporter permease subunit n=1 Tax=Bacillus sp. FJAT-44742 TaxID=2014005 RepID=UPI001E328D2E|nr:efflux RND transporter permease subunit [Bacillus sp. FJAT-44742]
MKLLGFIVKKKILVGLLSTLIIFIGLYAIYNLDKELFPPINLGGAYVDINAGDMSAAEVERTITVPLEEQIASIDGVREFSSTSYIGNSSLYVFFEEEVKNDLYPEIETAVKTSISNLEQ